jgi:hypothetical protein
MIKRKRYKDEWFVILSNEHAENWLFRRKAQLAPICALICVARCEQMEDNRHIYCAIVSKTLNTVLVNISKTEGSRERINADWQLFILRLNGKHKCFAGQRIIPKVPSIFILSSPYILISPHLRYNALPPQCLFFSSASSAERDFSHKCLLAETAISKHNVS